MPDEAAPTAAGPVGWIFRTGLKASMDRALRVEPDTPVQRGLGKPQPQVLGLKSKNPVALEGPAFLAVRR